MVYSSSMKWRNLTFLLLALSGFLNTALGKTANIVFIISDDQDARLGSLNYMQNVQKSIIAKGINVKNHFGTVALCCPARATLMRGQAAHNTNVTHVGGAAGAWPKFLATGENNDYLPHWLKKAGYTTAYFGKFMNGYGMRNYDIPPSGWDLTDLLVQPFIYAFNNVVMSQNGDRPVHYEGWHQTDVLRVKALQRLEKLTSQPDPFYLEIAPASPHVLPGGFPTVPLTRHMFHFPGVQAPRTPNWNPLDDELQAGKPAWIRDLPLMNESVIEVVDASFRARLQGLQGVDEIVEDVVALLERKGVLDETYIIYTTDNGFHLGNHRITGGKGTPYIEDVNLPLAIRGPGIPSGHLSAIPSSHVDMAPTILDIVGVPPEDWPSFFDGRSLLKEWQSLETPDDGISREVLNVEFWGSTVAPAGKYTTRHRDNAYKSLRLVGEKQGWLFNRWCTSNQTELYNTVEDPYELYNLAIDPSPETRRVMDRLSGLLLVTKSCGQDSCRKPWDVLSSACGEDAKFSSLDKALDTRYDSFFASLPHFGFQSCLPVQKVENEGPYFPPESVELGRKFRAETEDAVFGLTNGTLKVESLDFHGDLTQRYANFEAMEASARPLTDEEIGWPMNECGPPDYCEEMYED